MYVSISAGRIRISMGQGPSCTSSLQIIIGTSLSMAPPCADAAPTAAHSAVPSICRSS